jgi:hypothetical protein
MVRTRLKAEGIGTARPAAALALLEEVAAFALADVTPVTTLDRVVDRFPTGPERDGPDEGTKVSTAERNAIKTAVDALPDEGREWVRRIVGQARTAKVPISLSSHATLRRFELARGLIILAEDHDDETLRALVHLTCGSDTVLTDKVTAGAALGSLNADEATRFASHCDAWAHGRLAATIDNDGLLRLGEVA